MPPLDCRQSNKNIKFLEICTCNLIDECIINDPKLKKKFATKCMIEILVDKETSGPFSNQMVYAPTKFFNESSNKLCDLMKQTLYNHNIAKLLTDINTKNTASYHNLAVSSIEQKIFLGGVLKKNIKFVNENKKLSDDILKKDAKIGEQRAEMKILRRKIKNLTDMVSKMHFNTCSDDQFDLTQLEPLHTSLGIYTPKHIEPVDALPEISDDCHILLLYETLKAFMVEHDVSIKQLCKMEKKPVGRYLAVFLNIQWMRVNIAHPKIQKKIKTGREFFELLDGYQKK